MVVGKFRQGPAQRHRLGIASGWLDGERCGGRVEAAEAQGERLTFEVTVLEGSLGDADGPASIFIDTIWFGIGSGGITYLGQNATTGGTSPAIGSRYDSAYSGWSNPAPNEPPGRLPPDYGLTTPPGMGGESYKAQCGAPPLLPCY